MTSSSLNARSAALPNDPMTKMMLGLSLPAASLRDADARLSKNPAGGPRFAKRNDVHDLRMYYCASRVITGVCKVIDEFNATAGRGAIPKIAQQAYEAVLDDGRLRQFDRDWDLREYVWAIEGAVDWVGKARAAQREGTSPTAYGHPRWQIERLARASMHRLLPAIQNIGPRLPVGEQEAARRKLQHMVETHLSELDRLHEMTRTAGSERERWAYGFGAVDAAVLVSSALFSAVCDAADRMVDDGDDPVTSRLPGVAAEARHAVNAALLELRRDRMHELNVRIWRMKQQPDVVAFAQAAGGIGPELEVLFHSRGSRMLGY